MKLLLDTHALIWYVTNHPSLPEAVRALIEAPEHEVYVSGVSFHEMALKEAKGVQLTRRSLEDLSDELLSAGIGFLPVLPSHAEYFARRLVVFGKGAPGGKHGDPFDRMLIAQAIMEDCVFLSKDEHVPRYAPTLKYFWDESLEDFWRTVEGVRATDGLPLEVLQKVLKEFGRLMSRVMAKYGLLQLRPYDGKGRFGLSSTGEIELDSLEFSFFHVADHRTGLQAMNVPVEQWDEYLFMPQDQRLAMLADEMRRILIHVGFLGLEPMSSKAMIGWDANDRSTRFTVQGWKALLMPTNYQLAFATIYGSAT